MKNLFVGITALLVGSLCSCVSTRVGPRVGTDFPAGNGGLNTIAGITAEGWYSASGFVRVAPQIRTLHDSKHLVQSNEPGGYYWPVIEMDLLVHSRATFFEIPVMIGFSLNDSSRFKTLFAFGGSVLSRFTSTTTNTGWVEPYDSTGVRKYLDDVRTESTHSDISITLSGLAGVAYAITPSVDLRLEVQGTGIMKTLPFWEYEHSYTSGNQFVMITTRPFYVSLMCSAIFRL